MQRIVIAAGLYPPDIGGPATYAEMLVRELPSHGFSVQVLPYGEVRRLPKWRRHLTYAYRLWRLARTADLVYALDPMSVGVPARLVAWVTRTPFYLRLGGDYVWEQSVQRFGVTETLDVYTARTTPRPLTVRALAGLQTWVTRGARQIVVPSQYLAHIVAAWGVDKSKIRVIYSAHHMKVPRLNRERLRTDFQFTGTVLVSVARLTPWKGMRMLIELTARRLARGEVLSLVVVGDGPERQRLEAYVATLGITSSVRFVGALSQEAMFAVVMASDLFLLNTSYEGLSHQLLEVMALGTPIITTPVGGNPELLTDMVDGVLVPVDDIDAWDAAVTMVLADHAATVARVAQATERVKQFGTHNAVYEVATLFQKSGQ